MVEVLVLEGCGGDYLGGFLYEMVIFFQYTFYGFVGYQKGLGGKNLY